MAKKKDKKAALFEVLSKNTEGQILGVPDWVKQKPIPQQRVKKDPNLSTPVPLTDEEKQKLEEQQAEAKQQAEARKQAAQAQTTPVAGKTFADKQRELASKKLAEQAASVADTKTEYAKPIENIDQPAEVENSAPLLDSVAPAKPAVKKAPAAPAEPAKPQAPTPVSESLALPVDAVSPPKPKGAPATAKPATPPAEPQTPPPVPQQEKPAPQQPPEQKQPKREYTPIYPKLKRPDFTQQTPDEPQVEPAARSSMVNPPQDQYPATAPVFKVVGDKYVITMNAVLAMVAVGLMLVMLVGSFVVGRITAPATERIVKVPTPQTDDNTAGAMLKLGEDKPVEADPYNRSPRRFYLMIETLKGMTDNDYKDAENIQKFCEQRGLPCQIVKVGRTRKTFAIWCLLGFKSTTSADALAHVEKVEAIGKEYFSSITGTEYSPYKFLQREKTDQGWRPKPAFKPGVFRK